MAATVTDSAANGTKLEEGEKVIDPANDVAAVAETAGKGVGDLKASSPKVAKEEVVPNAPADSSNKVVSATKALEEVVTKEMSDQERRYVEPAGEDLKASSEVKSDIMNAVDSKERKASKEAKVGKETNIKEVKQADVKKEMKIDSNKSREKDLVVEEEKAEAMDIDDKKQERTEEKVEPKVKQKAGVVVNPVKKLGRPKKTSDPEKKKEEPKTPSEDTKKRPRQRKEPMTPLPERDRPPRERKSIERFVASTEKGKRELIIKQGTGTPLMDIPNVAFKLSKRAKGDEILNMLHSLLYNQRAKANAIKYNVFRFSGYVWTENEEKERNKVKEKLERYTKEGLGQLSDVLDLQYNKTGKKEELVLKVLEFLESPHKTTDVSLEEREQKLKEKKRKSRTPGRGRGGTGRKRRKLEEPASAKKRGRRKKSDSEEETEGDYANSEDESLEEEEEVEVKRLTFVDEHDDEDEDYQAKQKPQKRPTKSSREEERKADHEKVSNDEEESEGNQAMKRSAGKSTPSASVKSPRFASSPDISRSSSKPAEKVYTKGSRKKTKELKEKEKEEETHMAKRMGKQKAISKEKVAQKSSGRGRRGKAKEPPVKKRKSSDIPSDEVLQNEIRDLLKDLSPADFSKVTFMDIVNRLEDKFNVELSVNKAHVKLLIRQEVSRLAEEGDEDDDDQEGTEVEGEAAEAEADAETEEAGDTAETAGKAETPEPEDTAEEIMEADDAAAPDLEETGKDVEAGAIKGGEEFAAWVPNKANNSKDTSEEEEQVQTAELADITAEGGAAGD